MHIQSLNCSSVQILLLSCRVLQVLCYVDRTSVAFAAPEMLRELHFSTSTYGLGAAAFFVGYTLLQVCSCC